MATAPLVFEKAEEAVNARLARWGFYSRYGRGKTTLLSTIPAEIPTLVVNTPTENIKPLAGKSHFVKVSLTEWDQTQDLFLTLRSKTMVKGKGGFFVPNPDYVSGKGFTIKALAFDTVSKLMALAAMKARGTKTDPETAYEQMTKLIAKEGKNYAFWENIGSMVIELVTNFVQLPMHVIFLFQEETRETEHEHSASPAITGPQLTPAALKGVMPIIEMVGRLVVASDEDSDDDSLTLADSKAKSYEINPTIKEVRWLLIGQHDRYLTKGPTHILGYAVKNPTWAKLAASLDPARMAVDVKDDEE